MGEEVMKEENGNTGKRKESRKYRTQVGTVDGGKEECLEGKGTKMEYIKGKIREDG